MNDKRFRQNKLNRVSRSDDSIRWLLDASFAMKDSHESVLIVPINVSYDRIYENRNLAIEMVNGEKQNYTMMNVLSKMFEMQPDTIGAVHIKYLDPINLDDWLQKPSNSTIWDSR